MSLAIPASLRHDRGLSKRNEKLDAVETAAWTTVASVILNLDETVTKG